MATINDAGAAVKTLQAYLEQVRAAYQDIDEGWNISPESPDGQAIAVWSELLALLDEQLINAYRSVDPSTAIGQQLDRIARISGIERQDGTFSTAQVTFSGTNGTVVPSGTEVRNSETDTIWETDGSVEITGGEADVGVTCTTVGPEPAAAGDLSVIATPVSGVSSVTNDNAASLGRPVETDALLRVRRNNSVSAPGSNQVDSMFGDVANVDDVKHVRIYENVSGSTDANGLDGHSIAVFVDGGTNQAVAEAIAVNKNPGTGLNADNSFANKVQVSVETEEQSPLDVTFYRPEIVTAFLFVEITGSPSSETVADIKEAIVDYANAELFTASTSGFDKTGFGIGEVVPVGKLYTPVNRVLGTSGYVSDLTIGESSGDVTNQSIDPGFNGLVTFNADNITVSVV